MSECLPKYIYFEDLFGKSYDLEKSLSEFIEDASEHPYCCFGENSMIIKFSPYIPFREISAVNILEKRLTELLDEVLGVDFFNEFYFKPQTEQVLDEVNMKIAYKFRDYYYKTNYTCKNLLRYYLGIL